MSMTPIVATPPGAPEIPPQPLTFFLTSASLNAVLTPEALRVAIPTQLYDNPRINAAGATPAGWSGPVQPTPTMWASMASNIDPVQIKSLLAAALVGGGMTEGISVGDRPLRAVGVADFLFRAAPLVAAQLAAQIVNACVAAG